MKKIYLVLTPVLLLLVALSFGTAYVQGFESGEIFNSIFSISLAAVTFLSLGMMFREGTFRKTVWCRFAYVGTAILIMGILFRIQHWPNALAMVITGSGLITISYLVHFIRKPMKQVLDWFKAVAVCVFFLNILSALARFPFREEFNLLAVLLVLGLICMYYVEVMKAKKKPEAKLTIDGEELFDYHD